uniref:Ataxin-10 domain-containing protein n=1 Tax=Timema bartmani TaxID=61472 RepID=A0A7R9HXJ6_9NEOP|nr:unnamed protein product [Timema bartmani]
MYRDAPTPTHTPLTSGIYRYASSETRAKRLRLVWIAGNVRYLASVAWPFVITQWAIFSVRNLCEGNPESQALIAGLTQRGTVDSATLRELGITLHQEDDKKIVIMPYKP